MLHAAQGLHRMTGAKQPYKPGSQLQIRTTGEQLFSVGSPCICRKLSVSWLASQAFKSEATHQ